MRESGKNKITTKRFFFFGILGGFFSESSKDFCQNSDKIIFGILKTLFFGNYIKIKRRIDRKNFGKIPEEIDQEWIAIFFGRKFLLSFLNPCPFILTKKYASSSFSWNSGIWIIFLSQRGDLKVTIGRFFRELPGTIVWIIPWKFLQDFLRELLDL